MKRYLLIALAAGALVACQSENEAVEEAANFVKISPVITRATEVNFEDGDQIGLTIVYGSEAYATNSQLTYADNVFSGSLEWYTLSDQTSTLTAYYPYDAAGAPETFTVLSDQSTDANYTASDLMAATKSDVTPSTNAISMVFKHQLTKILVEVDNVAEIEIASVVLKNSIPTATVDLDNLSVAVDETASTGDITAQAVTAGSEYRAIVVPQTATFELVITRADGLLYSASLASAELQAGGQYTVNATLTADHLAVSVSGEIENWTDDGVIGEGDALEEHLDENYIIYHGETYATVTLSNGTTWMAENMRYIPSGYSVSSDPTTGSIWYPYSLDYDQAVTDDAVKTNLDASYVVVLTDEESVKEKGYLYNFEAIYGEALSSDNYLTTENAQGICPEGWHIPNRAEYYDIVGASNANTNFGEASGTKINSSALFWDTDAGYATVGNAIANDFFVFSGYKGTSAYGTTVVLSSTCTNEDYYGESALSYYWTSTGRSDTQVFGLMTTFTSTYTIGRLSLAFATATFGAALRCVKDHNIDFYATYTDFVSPSAYDATLGE